MRNTDVWKSVKVKKSTHDDLLFFKDDFQCVIGGGSWSMDDTIKELIKIVRLHSDE